MAWRTLKRDKRFAALNIIGLAIGIVACLLIFIYVQDELSFDAHHAKADRIFRVQSHFNFGDQSDDFGLTQFAMVPTLLQEYPEIESGSWLYSLSKCSFTYEGRTSIEDQGYYADTAFFRTFDYHWVHGGPHALDEPDHLVITTRLAHELFGAEEPMGKLVERNGRTLKVAGVIDEHAYNTHVEPGCFLSLLGMPPQAREQLMRGWGQVSSYGYLVLAPGITAGAFQPKMDAFMEKHILPFWRQDAGFTGTMRFNLEPLREVYFNNTLIYDTPRKGNRSYVTLFSIVAVLILAIACINYINMSTADATRRAKEVALRKVSGAQRGQLVAQFIGGSVMISLFGIVVALGLLWAALPAFNGITGKEIGMADLLRGSFLGVLLLMVVLIGVVAGSYPAFFLARFAPQLLLKDGIAGAGSQRVRKVLMSAQFAIALFMVVGTLAVFAQLQWLRNNDMGLRKENVLMVKMPAPHPQDTLAWDALRTMKTELARESFVQAAAFTDNIPGGGTQRWVLRARTPDGPLDKPLPAMSCDADYPSLIGMVFTQGRTFDPAIATDRDGSIIVNEALVKAFGWSDPLNERLFIPGDSADQELRIIGVVKDFHYTSLHTPIEPIAIFQGNPRYGVNNLLLRLAPGDIPGQLKALEGRFKALQPNAQWDATFLDTRIAELYQAEDKLYRVFIAFAVLAIVLTVMGLYGLAYFTARQRTREIGIRRVMGAPLFDIVRRLNKEFILLLGLALLVAFPFAFYAIDRWLGSFAYHTSIPPALYVAALLITLIVTVLTVSVQAYRAAVADPVKALRYE
ncbi:MAG: ABC transporter permease [Flavobacteriales bacterium]|nr:ABC transporter permease [Flavobacteriales bacterium]